MKYVEHFSCYPYEYGCLNDHFHHMAKKGWILHHINIYARLCEYVYEKGEPVDVYYHVDFISDVNIRNKQTKIKDYQSFIEEYGYIHVCTSKDMVVFQHAQKDAIELRDESHDTKVKLEKATIRNMLTSFVFLWMLWIIFYMPLFMDLFSGNLNTVYLSINSYLFRLIAGILFVVFILVEMIAPLKWLIIHRVSCSFMRLKSRAIFVVLFCVMAISSNLLNTVSVVVIFLMMLLMSLYEIWWCLKSRYSKRILIILALCFSMIALCIIKDADDKNLYIHKAPFDSELMGYSKQETENVLYNHSCLLTRIDDSNETFSYTVVIIAQTFFKDELKAKIPYEYDDVVHKEKQKILQSIYVKMM